MFPYAPFMRAYHGAFQPLYNNKTNTGDKGVLMHANTIVNVSMLPLALDPCSTSCGRKKPHASHQEYLTPKRGRGVR